VRTVELMVLLVWLEVLNTDLSDHLHDLSDISWNDKLDCL